VTNGEAAEGKRGLVGTKEATSSDNGHVTNGEAAEGKIWLVLGTRDHMQ
jgi:hypothetical protein